MAKTNAERQREYRQRQLEAADGAGARLDLIIGYTTKLKLERLASYYRVTQREVLALALKDMESRLLDTLSGTEQDQYHDKQLSVTR